MRDREKEKSMSYIKNADIQGNAWVAPRRYGTDCCRVWF